MLRSDLEQARDAVADVGYRADWNALLALLRKHPQLANAVRLEGSSHYAPLHQAAWHGAPLSATAGLVGNGAWRMLRNAKGERPIDVAERKGHRHLIDLLRPEIGRGVPNDVLSAVQAAFHATIVGRIGRDREASGLSLPQLGPMLEHGLEGPWWFPVPGMYGGFSYWLEKDGKDALLISESWNRVIGGSGERHEITASGSRLVATGFV